MAVAPVSPHGSNPTDLYAPPRPTPAFPLPPDVFADEAGNLWHRMLVHKGFFDANDQPLLTPDAVTEARRKGLEIFEDHDEVPRPCIVPPPWANRDPESLDPGSVEQLRKLARREGKDFLHPVHGWLSWGRKRMREAPENLGTGAIQRRRQRTPVPSPEIGMVPDPAIKVAPAPTVESIAEPQRTRRTAPMPREE